MMFSLDSEGAHCNWFEMAGLATGHPMRVVGNSWFEQKAAS
jgi:hypothetical protein